MKSSDFDKVSYQAYQDAMAERFDFKTCARNDGSTYGIPSGSDCGSGRKEVKGGGGQQVAGNVPYKQSDAYKKAKDFNKRMDKLMKRLEQHLPRASAGGDKQIAELPKPKVHYLKDMDPYDPRRGIRMLAPADPLPPASYRPGLPPRGLV